MKPQRFSILFLLTCLTVSCGLRKEEGNEYIQGPYHIRMEQQNDTLSILYLDVEGARRDSMPIPYPVYRFDCGDLTGDDIPEICVGVIKATRYWPVGRRLFIYHLYRGRYIRPLWLGSRVGYPLKDFTVCRDSIPACIHTLEIRPDCTLVRNEYNLFGFGLQFRKHLNNTGNKEN